MLLCRVGNLLISFLSESLVFCKKMSKLLIPSKNPAIRSLAHFWWVTWAKRWLSFIFGEQHIDSLTLLIFGERPEQFAHITHLKRGNERTANFFKNWQKCTKKYNFSQQFLSKLLIFLSESGNEWFAKKTEPFTNSLFYHEQPERIAHGCSFVMSDLSDSLTIALWHEPPERFAHSHSFVLSDVSKSLTVTHLIRANEWISVEQMSEFPTLLLCHEWPEWFAHIAL